MSDETLPEPAPEQYGREDPPGGDARPLDRPGMGPESWPPVIESPVVRRRIQRWLTEPDSDLFGSAGGFAPEDIHYFRPVLRAPVPVLMILDNGSREYGEEVRIRGETLRIGRTEGAVTIPGDAALSQTHAEIRRVPWKGGFQWHLVDLESRNGTFVRCSRAVLHEAGILILGNRRFRLRAPFKPEAGTATASTRMVDNSKIPTEAWPTLQETTGGPAPANFLLRSDELTVGRTGGGADIEIDDPLLAYKHAKLKRMRDSTWMISAERTRNGVWASVTSVVLGDNCFFRCGEQLFRFTIP